MLKSKHDFTNRFDKLNGVSNITKFSYKPSFFNFFHMQTYLPKYFMITILRNLSFFFFNEIQI